MLSAKTVDVTSTPTLVVDGSELTGDVTVRLQTSDVTVIGGPDVTVSPAGGYFLQASTQDFAINLEQGDSLYAAVASTGQVSVLIYSR